MGIVIIGAFFLVVGIGYFVIWILDKPRRKRMKEFDKLDQWREK